MGSLDTLLKPFLLSRSQLDVKSDGRGSDGGIFTTDVSFAGITAGKAYKIFGGHHFGFSIVSFSTGQTDVTMYTSRPRGGVTGQVARVGLQVKSEDGNPISEEIWFTKGAAAAGVTMRIAIFLRPGSMEQFNNFVLYGPDGTAGEVRNADADADFAEALGGLVTNARLSAFNVGGDYVRLNGGTPAGTTGAGSSARTGLHTIASTFGTDTGDNSIRAIEARAADANGDFAKTLYGLNVNSRLALFDTNQADWTMGNAAAASLVTGEAHNAWPAMRTASFLFGRETSGNTMRVIEARAAVAEQSPGLYRLLTDAAMRVYDVDAGMHQVVSGLEEFVNSDVAFEGSLSGRESGFWASRKGRRFVATSEGTAITVSNGFGATAPRFTLEAGATSELIVRRIRLSCLLAGTTNLQWRAVLDPDARYSSGGTAGTVGARTNTNGGSGSTGGYTFHYGGITATATDADEREIAHGTIVNVTGNERLIEFQDGLIVGASGTLLLYLYDAGAVGTITVDIEFEECNVQ